MNTDQLIERYSRQRDIVPMQRLHECKVTVIGVGAIGRQIALQLAAIGIRWLQLIDFDKVEASNLASQGYWEEDLGTSKVQATSDLCYKINESIEFIEVEERFNRRMEIGNAVFCCVDSIQVRQLIWSAVGDKVLFFCDGRMSAETMRILTACDTASRYHYPKTLFATEEAFTGTCTAKTTIYCANMAAALIVAQFTKYLRHLPVDPDVQFNLLAMECSVTNVQ